MNCFLIPIGRQVLRAICRCRTFFRVMIVLATGLVWASDIQAQPVTSLRVMSFNIYVGGAAFGPLSRTVGVIQAAQADIVGIQEVRGSAQAIANSLGFYYHGFDDDLAIISRYPITQVFNEGVRLHVSPTQDAYLFNVHLTAFPYQPYDIRDGSITTEAQAIAQANATRGAEVTSLLNDMRPAMAPGIPVFLTGDFNEPSHLDWTQAAANAGLHFGKKVDWPASHSVVNAGLTDSFRQVRPDVINDRANTWTPGSPAPTVASSEVFDRIDFVYHAGTGVTPLQASTLGYNANDGNTDIGIQPYPSDHRAVVVKYSIPSCAVFADLNGSCGLDGADWTQFRTWQLANLTGLTPAQAYAKGDLNGDFRNDYADFVMFKKAFETANGTGSFATMLVSVPEPNVALLGMLAAISLIRCTLRHRNRVS